MVPMMKVAIPICQWGNLLCRGGGEEVDEDGDGVGMIDGRGDAMDSHPDPHTPHMMEGFLSSGRSRSALLLWPSFIKFWRQCGQRLSRFRSQMDDRGHRGVEIRVRPKPGALIPLPSPPLCPAPPFMSPPSLS